MSLIDASRAPSVLKWAHGSGKPWADMCAALSLEMFAWGGLNEEVDLSIGFRAEAVQAGRLSDLRPPWHRKAYLSAGDQSPITQTVGF